MKKVLPHILVPLISLCCIVGLDQWTKYLTVQNLSDGHEAKFIGESVVFSYQQNRGMAWGLFQNNQVLFTVLTLLAISVIIFLYVRTPWEPEYRPIRIAEVMLVGGALGNLIDRVFRCELGDGSLFHGYVVDMIYVKAINFPVFNVADVFVSLAFVFMIILLIFVYNEEEFNKCFGNFKPRKVKAEKAEEAAKEGEKAEEEKEEGETEEAEQSEEENVEEKTEEAEKEETVETEETTEEEPAEDEDVAAEENDKEAES